jgi:photosystem II stability/assembly factor-like uncharacterized protein
VAKYKQHTRALRAVLKASVAAGVLGMASTAAAQAGNWAAAGSTGDPIEAINFFDANQGWIGGAGPLHDGHMNTTADGGETFDVFNLPNGLWEGAGFYHAQSLDGTHVYAVGAGGVAMKSADGGATWTDMAQLPGHMHGGVHFFNENVGVALTYTACYKAPAQRPATNGILRTTDGGATWQQITSRMGACGTNAPDAFGDTILWAAGDTIWRSDDQGATWQQIPIAGADIASINAGSFITPDVGYVVGRSGMIKKTTDGGATWADIASPAANHLFGVDFVNESEGWITGIDTLLHTQDGGATWIDESAIVAANGRPTAIHAVCENVAYFGNGASDPTGQLYKYTAGDGTCAGGGEPAVETTGFTITGVASEVFAPPILGVSWPTGDLLCEDVPFTLEITFDEGQAWPDSYTGAATDYVRTRSGGFTANLTFAPACPYTSGAKGYLNISDAAPGHGTYLSLTSGDHKSFLEVFDGAVDGDLTSTGLGSFEGTLSRGTVMAGNGLRGFNPAYDAAGEPVYAADARFNGLTLKFDAGLTATVTPHGANHVVDDCPNDANKTEPGLCGCGVTDADTDADGTADCDDPCPNDAAKTDAGACGCGQADTDTDADGAADCNDPCPNDAGKTAPGLCGCGTSDADLDGDTTPDCNDPCPDDGLKVEAGICGCGMSDTDSDADGTADCLDGCIDDPNKAEPGVCGCAVPDDDSDGDATLDCNDGCPADAAKIAGGICGCGISDADSDADGTADCHDGCPADASKIAAGQCGCGQVDTDTDADGIADCVDACPTDATNDASDSDGVCDDVDNCVGAANADQSDADADGAGDACDTCPDDADNDADLDGVCGDIDNCAEAFNPAQADSDGDGAGDLCDLCPLDAMDDEDADGLCADEDPCPVDALNDADADGHCESQDNCAAVYNPTQSDHDADGEGDVCEGALCEIGEKACRKANRADVRTCGLEHNICKRECPRRDRACREACNDQRTICETTADTIQADCQAAASDCVPRRDCVDAARDDFRHCRGGAQSDFRSCRQSCNDADDRRACRHTCRDTWRAERDRCRLTKRAVIQSACREPFEQARECRDARESCVHASEQERRACRADCGRRDGACRTACDVEHSTDRTSCIDEEAACLGGI